MFKQETETPKIIYPNYAETLEHIEDIFNRLCIKKKLGEACKKCVFLEEIEKLRLLVREEQIAQFEKQIGYSIH